MDGCTWCLCNEKMKKYHDEEWGVPLHDDHRQFEFLMMEVMQCGLNWNMICLLYTSNSMKPWRMWSARESMKGWLRLFQGR